MQHLSEELENVINLNDLLHRSYREYFNEDAITYNIGFVSRTLKAKRLVYVVKIVNGVCLYIVK